MSFTALHRVVGAGPGPLTDELLDAAVAAGVAEANDLDWKAELPPARGLPQTDFPKDVAAMANSGGGVIVYGEGWQFLSSAIECAIADAMALIRATAEATENTEYDVRVGIKWTGEQPLTILTMDNQGFTYDGVSTPLHRYTPIETTVNAIEPALDYYWHVHDLAQDCVNQGGISNVLLIRPPAREDQA